MSYVSNDFVIVKMTMRQHLSKSLKMLAIGI